MIIMRDTYLRRRFTAAKLQHFFDTRKFICKNFINGHKKYKQSVIIFKERAELTARAERSATW